MKMPLVNMPRRALQSNNCLAIFGFIRCNNNEITRSRLVAFKRYGLESVEKKPSMDRLCSTRRLFKGVQHVYSLLEQGLGR